MQISMVIISQLAPLILQRAWYQLVISIEWKKNHHRYQCEMSTLKLMFIQCLTTLKIHLFNVDISRWYRWWIFFHSMLITSWYHVEISTVLLKSGLASSPPWWVWRSSISACRDHPVFIPETASRARLHGLQLNARKLAGTSHFDGAKPIFAQPREAFSPSPAQPFPLAARGDSGHQLCCLYSILCWLQVDITLKYQRCYLSLA